MIIESVGGGNCIQLLRFKSVFRFLYSLNFGKFIFGLFLLFAVTSQSSAKTLKQELNDLPQINIEIASFHFPPFTQRTKKGGVSGKGVETVKAFCTIARMTCEVILYPTARAYMNIENGTSDVLMTADIPRFERCCDYSKWSYPFVAGLITERSNDDIPFKEANLKGHSLVMVRGWQSIYDVYPNLKDLVTKGEVELIETNSIESAIKIYSRSRTSLLWGSRKVFEWYFNQMSVQWKEEDFKPMVLSSSGIWISKRSEQHKNILYRFNLAFQYLKAQGSLDKENFLEPSLMKLVYSEAETPN